MSSEKIILLIEDDLAIREALEELLESEGFNVVAAENGQIGLELLGQIRPAVILLDLMMPVMDGYAFLKALKQLRPEDARIPVFLITAAGESDANSVEVSEVLKKPLDIDRLLELLSRYAS